MCHELIRWSAPVQLHNIILEFEMEIEMKSLSHRKKTKRDKILLYKLYDEFSKGNRNKVVHIQHLQLYILTEDSTDNHVQQTNLGTACNSTPPSPSLPPLAVLILMK